MSHSRLLAILAHPDDESFGPGGTLAKYAREGVDVHVCTVTDGAAGSYAAGYPPGDAPSLSETRRQELACACRKLGVSLHTLNYRDSGMEGTDDNRHPDSLYQADLDDVARELVHIICDVRPHVIITHDRTGGSFHPDHIKVNQAVCHAWRIMGDGDAFGVARSGGKTLWRPVRLYFTVIPRSALKWLVRILRLLRRDPRRFGQNRDVDLTRLGVPDEAIHVRLDIKPYIPIKEEASACHRSQGGGALRLVPRFLRNRFLRYEYFLEAEPPGAQNRHDLFEGIVVME